MKFKLFLPLLVACMCLSGCGGGSSSSSSSEESSSSSEIEYYDPPTFDGEGIYIHYQRPDMAYSNWSLWIWEDGYDGAEFDFNGLDEYGAIAAYPLSQWSEAVKDTKLGFIVKSRGEGNWTSKDPDGDRFIEFDDLEKDENDHYHIYLVSQDTNIYLNPDKEILEKITSAAFYSETEFAIRTNAPMIHVKAMEDDEVLVDEDTSGLMLYTYKLDHTASFEKLYSAVVTFESEKQIETSISIRALFATDAFDSQYTYDGDDLGAIVSTDKASTTFKVWSPLSSEIKVRIYDSGTPLSLKNYDDTATDTPSQEVVMTKGEKGVFSATLEGNLSGKYYTYVVTNAYYQQFEIVDPYAKSSGVNGLRGMIVDFSLTNPSNWSEIEPIQYDRKELAVYETHLVDITSSETWNGTEVNRLTYVGAYESGTTYTEGSTTVSTGFDHIKELGVNAVQIIPIFDQANDEVDKSFNWGYNPLNYNVLEGSYSTNPFDGYQRIKEFKELVSTYNEAGINIIMDVVYNHVSGADKSNFDVLMPGYYYRYSADGSLSNGSGCGNETASEMPMFRKFMIDSATFWAKEYKLGGFRFDLMGLHDIETMNELTAACQQINPAITIYGEPWTGGTSTLKESESAVQKNATQFEGFGQFNDQMRDALIKGGLNAATDTGWVSGTEKVLSTDLEKIEDGIGGVTSAVVANIPADKTVNYVTCHDNYTLYDRLQAAGITDEDTIKHMAVLANSIVFTSLGTSFMLAGEEFLRTKGGNSNSYNASYEVNELDYSLKIKNADVFENYQKLIEFKTSTGALHLSDKAAIENFDCSSQNVISYTITDTATQQQFKIVHVNGYNSSSLPTVDFEGYKLYLDTLNRQDLVLSGVTSLLPFETIIVSRSL